MAAPDHRASLLRMEEARRQTQRQLDMVERQIIRRMTAIIPKLTPKQRAYRRGKPPDPAAFLDRYRSELAALTAERQPEIDALSRELARQDRMIAELLSQLENTERNAAGWGQFTAADVSGIVDAKEEVRAWTTGRVRHSSAY